MCCLLIAPLVRRFMDGLSAVAYDIDSTDVMFLRNLREGHCPGVQTSER